MSDWEKKERFDFPTDKESLERHAPEDVPGFWRKHGVTVFAIGFAIVIGGICNALGIQTPFCCTN